MEQKTLAAPISTWIGLRRLAHVCHHWISIVSLYSRTNSKNCLVKYLCFDLTHIMQLMRFWSSGCAKCHHSPVINEAQWSSLNEEKKRQIKYVLLLLGSIFTLLLLLLFNKNDDECKMWCWCANHGQNWVKVEHGVHDANKWRRKKKTIFHMISIVSACFAQEQFSWRVYFVKDLATYNESVQFDH